MPRFEARLSANAEADDAFAAASAFATFLQLRKLTGLPRTTETTMKAKSIAPSRPVITKSPRLARA